MTAYPFIVFVHVVGAVGIFATIAIETVSLGRLQRAATPADARVWMSLLALPWRLGPIPMSATLASGIWMMAVSWGPQPWLVSAFVGLVGMAVASVVSRRRTRRLRAALAAEPPSELPLRSGQALTASLRLRIALGVGILGLMTVKPGAAGSWLILAAAAAAGLIASIGSLAARRSRPCATTAA